jgi:hypothetical protein
MWVKERDVRVATLALGEITGIRELEGVGVAEVSYTLVREDITPFGKIMFNMAAGTLQRTATFTKFDDGWRIGD